MRRLPVFCLLAVAYQATTSCWVALPAPATPETKVFYGKTFFCSSDLDVVNAFAGNVALAHPAVSIGPKQKVLATIPAGTPLEAKRTATRIVMTTKVNYLVCYSPRHDLTFQIPEELLKVCAICPN